MKRINNLLPIIILILLGSNIKAQQISEVTGDIKEGNTITMSGTEFGEGGTIISWDNFEAHTTGTDFKENNISPIVGPTWTRMEADSMLDDVMINTEHSHSGNKSVFIEWNDYTINAFGWANQGPFTKLYITWWGYQSFPDSIDIRTCNRKWYYLYGNAGPRKDMPQGMPVIPGGNDMWGYYNNVSTPKQPDWAGLNNLAVQKDYGTGENLMFEDTKNKWQRWEYWQTLNTDCNCSVNENCDGNLTWWFNGIKKFERHDYKARFVNGTWEDFRLGHMWQRSQDQAKVWIDDVFISTSQARVEIGNNSTFENCTHREIQHHTSWTGNQISLIINQGSFATNDSAFLFVIDSEGNASPGQPITFSQNNNDSIPPEVSSTVIETTGTNLKVTLSEPTTGNNGFILCSSSDTIALTFTSGTSIRRNYITSRAIKQNEIITLSYLTGNIEDLSNNPLNSFSNLNVINNSTHTEELTNLALNKQVTVSSEPESANPGSSSVDGNTDTRWSARTFPQSMEVDLGDIYSISSTELVCYYNRAYRFIVEAKENLNDNYTQIVDRSSNTTQGTTTNPITDNFSPINARYVKIRIKGAYGYTGQWVSLLEFRVFGKDNKEKKPTIQKEQQPENTGIKIYPNPTQTSFTVSGKSNEVQIEVFSLTGVEMYKTNKSVELPFEVNISAYSPGVYFIKVSNKDKMFIKKVIKE